MTSKTKKSVDTFLTKINKSEDCGKITFDSLVSYMMEKVTSEDISNLQLGAITWVHEDRRLRRIWEKKNGKVTDSKWKEMLYIGHLASFINENSRLNVGQVV